MTDPVAEFPHEYQPMERPRFYDRTGQPIGEQSLADLLGSEFGARLVATTDIALPDRTRYLVSTLFLGLDHAFDGPPILYETAVFGGHEGAMQRVRSATERDARTEHLRLIQWLYDRIENETAPPAVPALDAAAAQVATRATGAIDTEPEEEA